MDIAIELLKILVTVTASVSTLAAVIYSWVWTKKVPKTWTITGMVSLLWAFALLLWSQRFILYYVDTITTPSVANVRSFFLTIVLIGYAVFLFGTYNSGPVFNNSNKKVK